MNVKDTESIKKEILKTAREVFRKNGFAKVSMEDIAKATKLGRSSLYYYFKSKSEIFETTAIQELIEILNSAANNTSSQFSIIENFNIYNSIKLRKLTELCDFYSNLVNDIRKDPNLLFKVNTIATQEECKIINQFLDWAESKNEIKPINKDEKYYISRIFSQSLSSISQEILLFGKVDDPTLRSEWIVKIIIKGIA